MRYIEGRSLAQRIHAEGPLPVADIVRVATEIGSALDALHAAGLVHRDVKPANIMLEADGSAILTDFGLAKGAAFTNLTQPGGIVGTMDYLAPERIRGEAASETTDIYALGCVVYESLAGHPPFDARSVMELGWAILQRDPPDPCAERDDAPRHLSATALLALAKDPAARPQTAGAYTRLLAMAARSG
jgi:serine/threonine-protein kinase